MRSGSGVSSLLSGPAGDAAREQCYSGSMLSIEIERSVPLFLVVSTTLALAAACDNSPSGTDAGPVSQADAGATADAAVSADSGARSDAGTGQDAGGSVDGATSADTWTNFAQGFFTTYCVPCHSANPPRDYSTMVDVMRDSAEIACGVSPTALSGCGSFPPPNQFPIGTGPHPSDADRQRIVAWIEAGLPE